MIGWLVDEIKAQKIYEDTTIIFWSDHGASSPPCNAPPAHVRRQMPPSTGYKLGEHCDWFKHDNTEDATRIITIVKPANGLIANPRKAGTIIEQMVEEVDIMPSLLQLHGLPVPVDLEGDSWVPLLQQSNADSPGKPRIFSQYPHPLVAGASKHGFSNYSGYTM